MQVLDLKSEVNEVLKMQTGTGMLNPVMKCELDEVCNI